MLAALFLVATIAAAVPLSRWLWSFAPRSDRARSWERMASIAILAVMLAVGLDWLLAFAHVFFRGTLVAVSAVLLAGAALATRRLLPDETTLVADGGAGAPEIATVDSPPATRPATGKVLSLFALAPLGAWLAYVSWRGTVIVAQLSDALSYHLPKALFLVRHHAFGLFGGTDARLTTFPANYEILLADVIALTGNDALTFAVGTLTFALFGLVVAAMAERWWGLETDGRLPLHVVLPTLLALAMPPALLAAGAHKNDLLTGAAVLAATHWAARWAVTKQRPALVLAIGSAALAIGTKVNAGVLVVAVVPCVVWRLRAWRRERGEAGDARGVRPAEWMAWGAFALGAFVLLGGGVYVFNIVKTGRPIGASEGAGGYGAWSHLWQFPVLAFLRGFTSTEDVYVPWLGVRWAWPEHDLFFAPFGTPTSVLLLAVPFGDWRYRALGRRDERFLASLMVVIGFFAVLPVKVNEPPVGFFIGIGRYAIGLPAVVFLWTVAPFVRSVTLVSSGRSRTKRALHRALAAATALVTSATFAYYAFRMGWKDQAMPFGFVVSVDSGRLPPRALNAYPKRAAEVVDAQAAPDAVVAFDGGFDAWVYPIFGAALSRHVVFLHPDRGAVTIPSNVSWVAIDRWWHCAFGDPRFTDFSKWE